ncbi:LPS assembly lipoprotein LptE [Nitratifractor sp.]
MAISIVVSGCGYRPVAREARATIPDPVYVDVLLSRVEPQNGIYLKEELTDTLRIHLHRRVVTHPEGAKTTIRVPFYRFTFSPLTYDRNGYVIRYRVASHIRFEIRTPDRRHDETIHTTEDVNVESSSLLSTVAREAAIRVTIRKALDKLIARIATWSAPR